jgi:hypothetical protein
MRRGMGFNLRRLILLNLWGHKTGNGRRGLAISRKTEERGEWDLVG